MNQDRFIELLNLYLDEEISSEDLSDLMAETHRDPDRRKVFREYNRIHDACLQVGASFDSRPARRSIRQTIYAIGGLAAAFALLAMAGRNLMPFIGGQEPETIVAQQMETEPSELFFPVIASTEALTPRFTLSDEEPRIRYIGLANGGSPIWSNSVTPASVRTNLGGSQSLFFSRDLRDASSLELKDPFNGFGSFGEAISLDFSNVSPVPARGFGSRLALEHRLVLENGSGLK